LAQKLLSKNKTRFPPINKRQGTAWKNQVIPGYTGYMSGIGQGTASLMGTYENCRRQANDAATKRVFGTTFEKERAQSMSPNAMYRAADPRVKTNSKNRSSINWGDSRDVQFTTMNSMQYLPHGALTETSDEHDLSDLKPVERRKLYRTAIDRVGQKGAQAVENAMKSKLTQRTAGGPGSLRSAFKYFDRDGSGTIDLHEFFKVLEFMGLTFSEDQVIALFGSYDEENAEGELDYNLFVERVMQGDGVAAPHYSSPAVADRFRRMGKAPSIKIGQDKLKVARLDVKRIFDKYDFDKSNTIDKKEMAAMLHAIGVTSISPDDVEMIIRRLDSNKSGVIEFDEFWNWFQNDSTTHDVLQLRY